MDDLLSAVPSPDHLPMYHSLHSLLKRLKTLSQSQLEATFRELPLAMAMFSPLALRTDALSSRFTDASRCAIDLSHALQYTTATVSDPFKLHSPSLLIAYAPAFHAITPSPQALDVSHNSLTDEQADILASTMVPHTASLRSLDISGNPGLCVAALAYIMDPLVHLTRFRASVPAAETSPAALAPLFEVASSAPALAILALIFPPLPPAPEAASGPMHDPSLPQPGRPGRDGPSANPLRPSDTHPLAPAVDAPAPPRPPGMRHRFTSIHQLSLVNLPAASEAKLLAVFPLSQLRMLDLSIDAHAGRARSASPATPPPHPLGRAAIATLTASPSLFPQLKALNLCGRCMHASHAHTAVDASAVAISAPPSVHPFFRNHPKLSRVDAGSVPFCSVTAHHVDSPAPSLSAEQSAADASNACMIHACGPKARVRALALVATGAPAGLPQLVSALTALTALEVTGIVCNIHACTALQPPQRGQGIGEGSVGACAEGAVAHPDGWGRAVRQLTGLQSLKLAHACACCGAATESAACAARALTAGFADLASLELAWRVSHVADAAAAQAGATKPTQHGIPGGSGGESGHEGPPATGTASAGFELLVASLGQLSALTCLVLCVPVHIPWQEVHEQVSQLTALQNLAMEAGGSARHACEPTLPKLAGGAEEVGACCPPVPTMLDVAGTLGGLSHLTGLTALRLSGVGALRDIAGAPPQKAVPADPTADGNRPDACGGHAPGQSCDVRPRGRASRSDASDDLAEPLCCMHADATERLTEAVHSATACRGRETAECPICCGATARGLAGVREAAARRRGAMLPGIRELVLEVATGVAVDVDALCEVLAGMAGLQRLEVATSGAVLQENEKRRLWESARGAPLLRGVHLR